MLVLVKVESGGRGGGGGSSRANQDRHAPRLNVRADLERKKLRSDDWLVTSGHDSLEALVREK